MRTLVVMDGLIRLWTFFNPVLLVNVPGIVMRVAMPAVTPIVRPVFVMREVSRVLTAHAEPRGGDAGSRHPFRPHQIRINGQASQRTTNLGERHAGVDQRAEDHVAGRAGEAVEVQRSQSRPSYPARNCILPDSTSE